MIAGAALLLGGCARHRGGLTARPATIPPRTAGTGPVGAHTTGREGLWYRVEDGDTLSSISRRSGVAVERIADANRLGSPLIKPGQRLWLPGADRLRTDPLEHLEPQPTLAAGGFHLVQRSQWTSAKVGGNHSKMGRVTRLTVHHTGQHKGFRGKSDVEIVQMIDRYHREGRHWSAIGYHYIIGRDGTVYEGRPCHIQGAHVAHNNPHNIGISCIGDFDRQLPVSAQLGALAGFLEDQRRRYGVAKGRVYGHRELNSSVCPGDELMAWVKAWRRA